MFRSFLCSGQFQYHFLSVLKIAHAFAQLCKHFAGIVQLFAFLFHHRCRGFAGEFLVGKFRLSAPVFPFDPLDLTANAVRALFRYHERCIAG